MPPLALVVPRGFVVYVSYLSVVSLRARDCKDRHVRDTCPDLEVELAEIEAGEPAVMG